MKRKASGKFVPKSSVSESSICCLPQDLLHFLLSFFDPVSLIKSLSISKVAQHAVYPSAFWDAIFHRHFVELPRRFQEALDADEHAAHLQLAKIMTKIERFCRGEPRREDEEEAPVDAAGLDAKLQRRRRMESGPWEGLDAIDCDPDRRSLVRFVPQFPVQPPVAQPRGPEAGAIVRANAKTTPNGAITSERLTLLELFRREAFRKIFVRLQTRSQILELSGDWNHVTYHFARTSRSSCFSCGYLIMEGCMERCIRQKSMQSPRSIHAACDVLLYGTKCRRFWYYYASDEAEPEDELVELAAVDDFCLWVVLGRDTKCIPVTCGVPVKDVKKLKRYHETYTNDFFKR